MNQLTLKQKEEEIEQRWSDNRLKLHEKRVLAFLRCLNHTKGKEVHPGCKLPDARD